MLEELKRWVAILPDSKRRHVQFVEGRPDRPKRAVWIVIETPKAVGQLTLWDTGECELEADRLADGAELVRRTVQVRSGRVGGVADELLERVLAEGRGQQMEAGAS